MDLLHLLRADEPLGSHPLSTETQLELQELRRRRWELSERLERATLECLHVQSEIKQIQKREEQLLDEVLPRPEIKETPSLVHRKLEPEAWTSNSTHEGASASSMCWQPQVSSTDSSREGALVPITAELWQQSGQLLDLRNYDSHTTPNATNSDTADEIKLCLSAATTTNTASTTRKRASVGTKADGSTQKKAKKLNGISFEELREHVANIGNLCDETTGEFKCPVCGRAKQESKYNSVRHLLGHLNDKTYHPFRCPEDGCSMTSVRIDEVQKHIVNVHKLEWNADRKTASVDAEKKALVDSLMKERK